MSGDVQTDLSGNPILKDVGPWLKSEIKKRFKDADVKYIDPSYLIRSIPTTSNDRIYCKILAHNAVHAAFAGFTGVTVGLVNTHYVILPIPVVIQAPRRVSLHLRLLTHTYTFTPSAPQVQRQQYMLCLGPSGLCSILDTAQQSGLHLQRCACAQLITYEQVSLDLRCSLTRQAALIQHVASTGTVMRLFVVMAALFR